MNNEVSQYKIQCFYYLQFKDIQSKKKELPHHQLPRVLFKIVILQIFYSGITE